MIERLNFYDLYGYLLPGLAFLALMWLPFGLVTRHWPPAEWSSALVALVLGYIAGHLVQGLAAKALPSTRRDRCGEPRYPSDILLDDEDRTFSPEVKNRLVHRIQNRFDIDVRDAANLDPKARKKRRQDAFFLCRRTLIQQGVASYAEQFEGMYALMRGVTAACILGAGYHLGWALARFLPSHMKTWLLLAAIFVAIVIMGLTLLTYSQVGPEKLRSLINCLAFWLLAVLLVILGGVFGSGQVITTQISFILFGIFIISVFISLRCYAAYQEFALRFAETVYRDFCAL